MALRGAGLYCSARDWAVPFVNVPCTFGLSYRSLLVIDALKSDEIVQKLGGRFKLTALIQRRLGELVDGARPLVERNGRTDFEVVIDEIVQEKITIDWEASGLEAPPRR